MRKFFVSETKPFIPLTLLFLAQLVISFVFWGNGFGEGSNNLYYFSTSGTFVILASIITILHSKFNNDYDAVQLSVTGLVFGAALIVRYTPFIENANVFSVIFTAIYSALLYLFLIDVLIKKNTIIKKPLPWILALIFVVLLVVFRLSHMYVLYSCTYCLIKPILFTLIIKNLKNKVYAIFSAAMLVYSILWTFSDAAILAGFMPALTRMEFLEPIIYIAIIASAITLNKGKVIE